MEIRGVLVQANGGNEEVTYLAGIQISLGNSNDECLQAKILSDISKGVLHREWHQ